MFHELKKFLIFIFIISTLLSACAASTQASFTQTPTKAESPLPTPESSIQPTFFPEETPLPAETSAVEITEPFLPPPTETPPQTMPAKTPLPLEAWKDLPVVPTVSQRAAQIYRKGLEMGRDPHRFSKIGDCQNVSSYFLSPFEYPSAYHLGEYTNLQEAIDWFNGSFSRDSLAVKGGFNVAAVLSPLRADPNKCDQGESPAACELRVFNPSFAIISMETWWSGKPENYEKYMRQLIEYLIDQGVVPILATKADNLEGGHQINQTLGQLAWEYDIPLWNFWASVQSLPDKGLTADGFHLTLGDYFYDNLQTTQTGWSKRNLTALQALDAVWRGTSNTSLALP